MLIIGEVQDLVVCKEAPQGVYLREIEEPDDTTLRVLLPRKEVPKGTLPGKILSVFLYKDSEDRPIATLTPPPLTLGKIAWLTVCDVTEIGAFLDWGLLKNLFLPYREQSYPVAVGDNVPVALYLDKSERLCATMHLYPYLTPQSPYHTGDQVEGFLYDILEKFGAYVAVDGRYSGMVPIRELQTCPAIGTKVGLRVTKVQPDGRLNLSLREKAPLQMGKDAQVILNALEKAGGSLPYHDKSSAQEIQQAFGLSKNSFKRAAGHLWKEGKIVLDHTHMELTVPK